MVFLVRTIIFDLDGTLCDTIYDLADATNFALAKMGYPTHSVEKIKSFVGNGIKNLMIRSMPEEERYEEKIEETKKNFFEYYRFHYADKTVAYEGILEVLKTLNERGIKLAVCTNKEDTMAKTIVKKLFGDIFSVVIGQGDKFPLKPNPESSYYIMNELGTTCEDTVFIGDSDVDIKTANNAGLESIGVSWGFRDVQELIDNGCKKIANNPLDIIKFIEVQ